jgi:hypothetical protein
MKHPFQNRTYVLKLTWLELRFEENAIPAGILGQGRAFSKILLANQVKGLR